MVAAAHAKEADRAIKNLRENPKFNKDNGKNDSKKQSRAEQALTALIDKPAEGKPALEKAAFWEQTDRSKIEVVRNALNAAEPIVKEREEQKERTHVSEVIRQAVQAGLSHAEIEQQVQETLKSERNGGSESNDKAQSGNQNSQQKNNSGSSQGKKSGGSSTGKQKNK